MEDLNILQPDLCCEPADIQILPQAQLEATANTFAVLADATRLGIFNLLARAKQAVCVCDITGCCNVSQPTISHHLKVLRDAGLITANKQGRWVYYEIVRERAAELLVLVQDVISEPVTTR